MEQVLCTATLSFVQVEVLDFYGGRCMGKGVRYVPTYGSLLRAQDLGSMGKLCVCTFTGVRV